MDDLRRQDRRYELDFLQSVSAEYGSDFYLLNRVRLETNFKAFKHAFERYVPKTRPAYSVKTNYLPSILREADRLGWYNEVVSGFEYDLVHSLGIDGARIIFNGPIKMDHEITKAIELGSLINVDSVSELERIATLSSSDRPARIALRCNLELETPTRFGIPINDPSFAQSIALCRRNDTVLLEGLHCHYCHPCKAPAAYLQQAEVLLSVIREHGLAAELKHINMGGGFFSRMPEQMAAQFGGSLPSVEDYAAAICAPLAQFLNDADIELILEPGLVVVADAMDFVTTVYDLKPVQGGQSELIVSGGVYNVKPGKSRLDMPFYVVGHSQTAPHVEARISGFTCMEDDVLHSQVALTVSVGDYLVFQNCGAYTNVLKPPFIRLAPPVLEVDADGIAKLILREETLSDIAGRFVTS
ncbi:MAG: hypothetical protein AAGK92_13880 [Pseudomonadota bacterium]